MRKTILWLIFLVLLLPFMAKVVPQFGYLSAQTLSSSGSTTWAGTSAVVDANVTLTGVGNLTGAKVFISSGLVQADDRLIYPVTLYGVTGTYAQVTGVLTLTGSATIAEYQEILRTIQYNNVNGTITPGSRTIQFALGDALPFQPCGAAKPHYYKFISGAFTFAAAQAAAAAQTHFGLQGYLATISCVEENSFASGSINQAGWIGASDAASEGVWKWIAGSETGTQFWAGLGSGAGGASFGGKYSNWNGTVEPNNSGASEHYAQFLSNGKWNDLPNTSTLGYYVEFGESAGDPDVSIIGGKTMAIQNIDYTFDGLIYGIADDNTIWKFPTLKDYADGTNAALFGNGGSFYNNFAGAFYYYGKMYGVRTDAGFEGQIWMYPTIEDLAANTNGTMAGNGLGGASGYANDACFFAYNGKIYDVDEFNEVVEFSSFQNFLNGTGYTKIGNGGSFYNLIRNALSANGKIWAVRNDAGTASGEVWMWPTITDFANNTNGVKAGAGLNLYNNDAAWIAVPNAMMTEGSSPGGIFTNLAVWLNAAAGVTAAGGQVSQWTDQSGSGMVTTQPKAVASADILNNANTANYNPVLTFSGAILKSLRANTSYNFSSNPLTIFAVSKSNGGTVIDENVFSSHDNVGGLTSFGPGLAWAPSSYSLDANGANNAFTTSATDNFRVIRGVYVTGASMIGGYIMLNGTQEGTLGTSANATAANPTYFEIGGRTANGNDANTSRVFKGDIAEVIVYNNTLSASDATKVETYLAAKYGITKAGNYVSSDGTVRWDATANATYHHHVTAIGHDTKAGLIQQTRSKSIETGALVEIQHDANMLFGAANLNYCIVGDNDGVTTCTNTISMSGTKYNTMRRVWLMNQASGIAASIKVIIPASSGAKYLFSKASDADFSTGATKTNLLADADPNFLYALVSPNNQYFTFASDYVIAPGIALNFDGVDDYVLGTPSLASSPTQFSISAWINPSDVTAIKNIVTYSNGATADQVEFRINGGKLEFGINTVGGGWQPVTSTQVLKTNRWTHVAVVKNNTAIELFIDEQSVATGTITNVVNCDKLNIGRRNFTGGSDFYFAGSIDEVSIWSKALSKAEINTIKGTQVVGNEASLEAYFNFNHGTSCAVNTGVTMLNDFTANSKYGTLNNFDLPTADCSSNWIESYAMVYPVAVAATDILPYSFTANWNVPANGTVDKYKLDVATDANFTNLVVTGQDVLGATSFSVGSLEHTTTYYYRVRAVKNSLGDIGGYSNVISVQTAVGKAPGGVKTSVGLWLKADEGVVLNGGVASAWNDVSGKNKNATATTGPALVSNAINYNPAFQFNGSQKMVIPGGVLGTKTYSDLNVFSVVTTDAFTYSFLFWETVNPARFSAHMPWPDGNIYWDAGRADGNGRISTPWPATIAKPYMVSLLSSTATTANGNKQDVCYNGKTLVSDANAETVTGLNNNFDIASSGSGYYHNGKMAEMAIYTSAITAAQKTQIESYFAIKYGITKTGNYVASNGNIWWDATANATYHNDVAGIARDNASGLHQAKSTSINGDILTVWHDVNNSVITNPAADMQAVVWGNNAANTNFGLIKGAYSTMNRVWKVSNPSDWGSLTYIIPSTVKAQYLLVSAAESFGTVTKYDLKDNGDGTKSVKAPVTNGQFITFAKDAPPVTQASDIVISNRTSNSLTLTWTNGSGANRAVFAFLGNAGSPVAVENESYTANAKYGVGSQIGNSGWYCVYNGIGNTTTVTGLAAATAYRFMVVEYNGTTGFENYLNTTATNNPLNATTLAVEPTVGSSNIKVTNITRTSCVISALPGNGSSRVVCLIPDVAGEPPVADGTTYTGNHDLTLAPIVGISEWRVVSVGEVFPITITGLSPITKYRVAVIDFNGTAGIENYLTPITSVGNPANFTTLAPKPTVQTTKVSITDVKTTQLTINWSNPNSDQVAVFMYTGTTATTPVAVDGETYNADSFLGNGSQIATSGWYCVYKGTGYAQSVTNLKPETDYKIMVVRYNGDGGTESYLLTPSTDNSNPAIATTTAIDPAFQVTGVNATNIQPTQLTINWANPLNEQVVVFMYLGEGATPAPVDRTTYTPSNVFKTGTQIGTSGWYCVYKGTGKSETITNLVAATPYSLMVVKP